MAGRPLFSHLALCSRSPNSPGVFRILNCETPRWANWLAPVVIPTARPRHSIILPSPLTCKHWRRGGASNGLPSLTKPGFSPITLSSLPIQPIPVQKARVSVCLPFTRSCTTFLPTPSLILLSAKREARVPNYASREGSTGKWLGKRSKDTSRGKDERDTSTGVRRVKVPAATRGFLRRRAAVAVECSIRPRRDRLSARSLAWRVRLASRESGAGLFCDHRVLPLFFFYFFFNFSLRRQFVGCVGHAELAIDTPAASHPDYVLRTTPRANATPTPTRNDAATDSPRLRLDTPVLTPPVYRRMHRQTTFSLPVTRRVPHGGEEKNSLVCAAHALQTHTWRMLHISKQKPQAHFTGMQKCTTKKRMNSPAGSDLTRYRGEQGELKR